MPKQQPSLNQADRQLISDVVDARIETKLEPLLEEKLNEKVGPLPTKDEFFTKMDQVLGEVRAMRQEFEIVKSQKDRIEDHEDRLETIETHLNLATA